MRVVLQCRGQKAPQQSRSAREGETASLIKVEVQICSGLKAAQSHCKGRAAGLGQLGAAALPFSDMGPCLPLSWQLISQQEAPMGSLPSPLVTCQAAAKRWVAIDCSR